MHYFPYTIAIMLFLPLHSIETPGLGQKTYHTSGGAGSACRERTNENEKANQSFKVALSRQASAGTRNDTNRTPENTTSYERIDLSQTPINIVHNRLRPKEKEICPASQRRQTQTPPKQNEKTKETELPKKQTTPTQRWQHQKQIPKAKRKDRTRIQTTQPRV